MSGTVPTYYLDMYLLPQEDELNKDTIAREIIPGNPVRGPGYLVAKREANMFRIVAVVESRKLADAVLKQLRKK